MGGWGGGSLAVWLPLPWGLRGSGKMFSLKCSLC